MEMNDNHIKYHTMQEFIEFCVNGKTKETKRCESKSTGKYFEGRRLDGSPAVFAENLGG